LGLRQLRASGFNAPIEQERAVPQAHRHIQNRRTAHAVAALRDRTPDAAPAAALTTLILGVLLTLLAQAGWMTLT
jgi:hypothetical protein